MARKQWAKRRSGASFSAEAVAKLSVERKKTVTEVIPPDVTRAKAAKWLDLISPFTEWAGLKGDIFRHQRDQLRIRQQMALQKLGEALRRKLAGRPLVQALPAKILFPALEAASLEDPGSPLINWWAQLLASGVMGHEIRPYFIDLMKAIGPREAEFLEELWTANSAAGGLDQQPVWVRQLTEKGVQNFCKELDQIESKAFLESSGRAEIKACREMYRRFKEWKTFSTKHWRTRGVLVFMFLETDWEIAGDLHYGETIDLCCGLSLLERRSYEKAGRIWRFQAVYVSFSELGVEFMRKCHPTAKAKPRRKKS